MVLELLLGTEGESLLYLEVVFNKLRCLVQVWLSDVPDMENSQAQRFKTRPKSLVNKKGEKKKTMKEGEWLYGWELQEMQSLRSELMKSRDQCGNTWECIEGKQQI